MKFITFTVCLLGISQISGEFLKTKGSDFIYGGKKVFLSGVNIAWNSYGYDFGNNQYNQNSKSAYENWVRQVHNAGGNTVRLWLHVEGDNSPKFDNNGFVTGTDNQGTLISELGNFLDFAYSQDVFVIIALWNGAVLRNNNYKNLYSDDKKLQSYIDKALVPMVNALKNKPALAAWEIINEPEGSVSNKANSNSCYDTTAAAQNGAGWSKANIPMDRILRFINWQASAVHSNDPKALVTIGSWSERGQTDQFGYRNYYKDSCLRGAGGKQNGIIDFYQMHTYSWEGKWAATAPFKVDRRAYNVNDKPLIIGEFASVCAENEGIEKLMDYAYGKGYNGALTWMIKAEGHCSDNAATQLQGLRKIASYNDQGNGKGGLVKVDLK